MSPELMNIFYQSHAGSWFFTLLFFTVSYIALNKEKMKLQKITHMILRLFFVIMLISGIGMLVGFNFALTYVVKGILALALIAFMEMILVRTKKRECNKRFMDSVCYRFTPCSSTRI